MKRVENPQVKFVQSFRGLFSTQMKILAFVHSFTKKLYRRCSTGPSIPTPLKLTIKTPAQHHSRCSCAFIVDFE